MKDFKGKVAVVTGAASGIGKGLAQKCVREGMKVVLADIDIDGLKQTAERLSTIDRQPLVIPTDVSKVEQIKNLAQETRKAFGGVHLLFNNAGVEVRGTVWEQTEKDWEWIINVNLWSVIHGIRVFVPMMLDQNEEAHIINTASGGALLDGPGMGSYRATKSAVFAITETLYHELKQLDAPIGVSVLYPSFVRSNLIYAETRRPEEYKNRTTKAPLSETDRQMIETFEKNNREAISPVEFAEMVFQGIRENKLYLRTHPEITEKIQERMKKIIE